MELVQDVPFKWQSSPSGIVPAKTIVCDLRWPVDASWLVSRCGIGSFLFIVEVIAIESAGGDAFSNGVKIPAADSLHSNRALWRIAQADVNPVRARSPEEKAARILTYKLGAKIFLARGSQGFCVPHVTEWLAAFSVYMEEPVIPRTQDSVWRG